MRPCTGRIHLGTSPSQRGRAWGSGGVTGVIRGYVLRFRDLYIYIYTHTHIEKHVGIHRWLAPYVAFLNCSRQPLDQGFKLGFRIYSPP